MLKIHSPSVEDDIIKINSYKHEAQERLIVEELATNLIGVKIASEKINKLKAKQMPISSKEVKSFKENFTLQIKPMLKKEQSKRFQMIYRLPSL